MNNFSKLTNTICDDFFSNFQKDTISSYRSTLIDFSRVVEKDILCVSKSDCEKYINILDKRVSQKKLKRSTLMKKYKELSSFYSYLVKNKASYGLSEIENYFRDIRLSPIEDNIKFSDTVDINTVDTVLTYCKENSKMTYLCILLSFKYMLRTGEMRSIRKNDLFSSEDFYALAIRNPRSMSIRYLRISNEIAHSIENYLIETNSTMYLFEKSNGDPFSVRTLQKHLHDACLACNIEPFSYNQLRNTGIGNANFNNISTEELTQALGISTSRHIQRLNSLKIPLNNVGNYVSIEIKP